MLCKSRRACCATEREFAICDVDSDNENREEQGLMDGIDFNLYLTRRLHDRPNRTQLDLMKCRVSRQFCLFRSSSRKTKTAVCRSCWLAEKRWGVKPMTRLLALGESSGESDRAGDVVICDQPTSQAKQQCARALVGFGDAEWREAHKRDLCLRRLLELKLSGGRW